MDFDYFAAEDFDILGSQQFPPTPQLPVFDEHTPPWVTLSHQIHENALREQAHYEELSAWTRAANTYMRRNDHDVRYLAQELCHPIPPPPLYGINFPEGFFDLIDTYPNPPQDPHDD